MRPKGEGYQPESKIGSITSFTAICATLSRIVGIPRGRFPPLALGIITLLTGSGL
jgi:hypothetical protein